MQRDEALRGFDLCRAAMAVADTPNSERPVPASIRKLIDELGLRYRLTRLTDLEAHAAALALLAPDLADVTPIALTNVIEQWARSSALRTLPTGNPRGLRWQGEGEDLRLTRER